MIREALKTILLVNGLVAVAFALFYELVKLCEQLGISPWFTAVLYVALYACWWVWECRRATCK